MSLEILGMAHIGVAVRSIEAALPAWEKLGFALTSTEEVAGMHLKVAFLRAGDAWIELLEPTDADTPVGRFLERRGEGMHHLAFYVMDIEAALSRAEALGLRLIDRTPRAGSHGMKIAFLHPSGVAGTLVELCQRGGA